MKNIINNFKTSFECVPRNSSWVRDFCERVENIFSTEHVDGVESFDMTLNYLISFCSNWKIGPILVHIPPSIFIHHK
jgi:hypothetical protein